MANIKQVDWESVEREYSLGVKSNVEIGVMFRISEASIRARAKKFEWKKDLSAKVRIAAESKLREANCESKYEDVVNRKLTEKEIIETTANIQATITLKHREKISKHQSLCDKLLEELIDQTVSPDELKKLGELMLDTELNFDKLNATYHKVISTPSRIDSMKKLSETAKTLVGLERQVYGIADNANGDADKDGSFESMLNKRNGR